MVFIDFITIFFFITFIFNFFVVIYTVYLFFEIKIFNHGQGAKLKHKKQNFLERKENENKKNSIYIIIGGFN